MKNIITLLSIIFLFSCNEQPKVKENETEIQNYTKFETFLLDFKNKNPNWGNNQKTKKETSVVFKKELTNFFRNNDSVFFYHPLQLEFTSNDGKFGLFRIWGTDKIKIISREPLFQDEWYVDVLIELPKSQIDTLVEKSYYRIIGKFNRYIKQEDNEFNLTHSWTFEPDVSKSEIGTETIKYNIGCLNIKPIKIEKIIGDEHNGDYYRLRKFVKSKD